MTGLARINALLGSPPPRRNCSLRQFETAIEAGRLQAEPPSPVTAEGAVDDESTEGGPDLTAQIKSALETLDAQARQLREQSHHELVDWLRAAFETAAPILARAAADAAFAQLLNCGKFQPVEIKVHPSIYDAFERSLPRNGGVSVVKDESMNACAVRASWQDGEMFVDPAAAADEISSLLKEKLNSLKTAE